MLTAHVLLNVSCQHIACNTQTLVGNNTTQADYGNLCATSTYVDNHIALRCQHVQANTYGSCHRLVNQVNLTTTGMLRAVSNGTQLNLGTTAGNTDYHSHARREQTITRVNHLNQAAHHLLTGIEVGNHTVTQRADGLDFGVRLLVHHFCLIAYGNHTLAAAIQGNNAGLVNHNPAITDNDGVSGTQVHRKFLAKRKPLHKSFLRLYWLAVRG